MIDYFQERKVTCLPVIRASQLQNYYQKRTVLFFKKSQLLYVFNQLKPGSEGTGVGEAKSNFPGDGKLELPVKEGESLTIISENGCPSGKWLVKNTEGHCMLLCMALKISVLQCTLH